LKSFAVEIAHFRQAAVKPAPLTPEAKLPPEEPPEENKLLKPASEKTATATTAPREAVPEKPEPEQTKAIVETKDTEKNLKINTEKTEEQKGKEGL
jgi:hypothetical protein